ncbi:MAG TPA: VOC family protein [Mucilaginibacter sp.]|nr:VOC family protein [Mucilaginibacter sp.]
MEISITALILLCVISLNTFPQATKLPNPSGAFAGIIVSDADKSADWFSTTFGMNIINKTAAKDRGAKQANLERGRLHIELIELRSAQARKSVAEKGFVKFGFTVPDFDRWYQFLTKQKVRFKGKIVYDQFTGKRMMIILDPDDNMIQLFE